MLEEADSPQPVVYSSDIPIGKDSSDKIVEQLFEGLETNED